MPRVTHWVRTRNPRLAQQQKVELEEGLVAGTAGAPLVYVILVLAATFVTRTPTDAAPRRSDSVHA